MANMSANKKQVLQFIVRRAFRYGSASRADLCKAFDISSASATRFIKEATLDFADLLERKGHGLVVKPLAKCPVYATENDLLENVDSGKFEACHTGLFEHELPINYVSWTHSMPQQPGIFQLIVTAIIKKKQLELIYLGLRYNESPRKRKVLPLSLEKMNDQWRVIAQDLEDRDFPVKVFVLPRILDASFSLKTVYIPFIKNYKDTKTKLSAKLNPQYTDKQKEMLSHELNIVDEKIVIATRSLHEFKRRFINISPSKDAVWPPLTAEEEEQQAIAI